MNGDIDDEELTVLDEVFEEEGDCSPKTSGEPNNDCDSCAVKPEHTEPQPLVKEEIKPTRNLQYLKGKGKGGIINIRNVRSKKKITTPSIPISPPKQSEITETDLLKQSPCGNDAPDEPYGEDQLNRKKENSNKTKDDRVKIDLDGFESEEDDFWSYLEQVGRDNTLQLGEANDENDSSERRMKETVLSDISGEEMVAENLDDISSLSSSPKGRGLSDISDMNEENLSTKLGCDDKSLSDISDNEMQPESKKYKTIETPKQTRSKPGYLRNLLTDNPYKFFKNFCLNIEEIKEKAGFDEVKEDFDCEQLKKQILARDSINETLQKSIEILSSQGKDYEVKLDSLEKKHIMLKKNSHSILERLNNAKMVMNIMKRDADWHKRLPPPSKYRDKVPPSFPSSKHPKRMTVRYGSHSYKSTRAGRSQTPPKKDAYWETNRSTSRRSVESGFKRLRAGSKKDSYSEISPPFLPKVSDEAINETLKKVNARLRRSSPSPCYNYTERPESQHNENLKYNKLPQRSYPSNLSSLSNFTEDPLLKEFGSILGRKPSQSSQLLPMREDATPPLSYKGLCPHVHLVGHSWTVTLGQNVSIPAKYGVTTSYEYISSHPMEQILHSATQGKYKAYDNVMLFVAISYTYNWVPMIEIDNYPLILPNEHFRFEEFRRWIGDIHAWLFSHNPNTTLHIFLPPKLNSYKYNYEKIYEKHGSNAGFVFQALSIKYPVLEQELSRKYAEKTFKMLSSLQNLPSLMGVKFFHGEDLLGGSKDEFLWFQSFHPTPQYLEEFWKRVSYMIVKH